MKEITHSPRLVFISACFGLLLFGITLITLGSVAPEIQQRFSLDALSSGALFSILPFGIFAGSLVFGPFADRYGYKIILWLSCVAMFIGFQGIAYASSLTVLKVCVFFFGFGGGAINGATNAVVSDISGDNKGANLSLLGVFFSIGALGMPFVLGILEHSVTVVTIVSSVGYLTLLFAVFFLFIRFPKAKQIQGVSIKQIGSLLKDNLVLFIAFFLFFQSGFEGIVNNWTTTYLMEKSEMSMRQALFALSLYVTGMAIMRLLVGSVMRNLSPKKILKISFALMFAGSVLIHFATTYGMAVTGLIVIGAGLASGFPVMLGFVGAGYTEVSGTAFSIVISIALVGNMMINYSMGALAQSYGVEHLPKLALVLTFLMVLLSAPILKKS